jgi:hypothetical protein
MIDLHRDNRDMPSPCVTCADQHCRDERDTPLGGVTVVTLVDVVPMPPFPFGGRGAGGGYAFALWAVFRCHSSKSSPNALGCSEFLRSNSLIKSEKLCTLPQYSFLFKIEFSGLSMSFSAASSDKRGGSEGFCRTETAHSLSGSFLSSVIGSARIPTAICDIVAAVCCCVRSIFQTQITKAAMIAIIGFATISSLSHPSFFSVNSHPLYSLRETFP